MWEGEGFVIIDWMGLSDSLLLLELNPHVGSVLYLYGTLSVTPDPLITIIITE